MAGVMRPLASCGPSSAGAPALLVKQSEFRDSRSLAQALYLLPCEVAWSKLLALTLLKGAGLCRVAPVPLGNHFQRELIPTSLCHDMGGEINVVKPMSDNDDYAGTCVVQASLYLRIKLVVDLVNPRIVVSLVYIEKVIDYDDVGALTSEFPVRRGRKDPPPFRRLEVCRARPVGSKPCVRQFLEPTRSHNIADRVSDLLCKRISVCYDHDALCRIASKDPGHHGDREQEGFEMCRREVDHLAPNPSLSYLRGDVAEIDKIGVIAKPLTDIEEPEAFTHKCFEVSTVYRVQSRHRSVPF